MKLIRDSIFETNSSSTHSLTLCMNDDIIKWKNGEAFYVRSEDKLLSGEALDQYYRKSVIYDKAEYKSINGKCYFEYKGVKYENIRDAYTEENLAEITQEDIDNWKNSEDLDCYEVPLSYDEYWDSVNEDGYYGFEESITTPNNEEVVAFGYYGNDY